MQSPSSETRVLVIDDDRSMPSLVKGLVDRTTTVLAACNLAQGMQIAREQRPDVILLDHILPDGAGLDRIEELIHADRLRPILFVTAQSDSATAIASIKRGAFDYLSKPIDFAFLKQRLAESIEYRKLTRTPVVRGPKKADGDQGDVLVGRCRSMQDVYKAVGRLSEVPNPVLIEGEHGTGKELIARMIHQFGACSQGPFERISAASLDDSAFQNALFGTSTEPGLLEQCQGGALMIEDFERSSSGAQSRLLSFLRSSTTDPSRIKARLIFSTTAASRTQVERGQIRSDLYYLLSPYVIRVPPLRERTGDLELLVSHFIQKLICIASTNENDPPRISQEALARMREYSWPGNIAELQSVIEQVLHESRGAIIATESLVRILAVDRSDSSTVTSVPASLSARSRTVALTSTTDELSRRTLEIDCDFKTYLLQQMETGTTQLYDEALAFLDHQIIPLVLQRTRGNRAQAARILGITRTSLRRKMLQHNIGHPEEELDILDAKGELGNESSSG